MTTPDLMPILSSGSHADPSRGACIMEYASLLAGEVWSDSPACTHPVLAAMARVVNDRLEGGARQSLLPLLPRLMGTSETGTADERHRLRVSLAVWCAEKVVHLTGGAEPESREAIRVTRAWLDGEATGRDAANAASAANGAAAYAAYATASAFAYGAADGAAAQAAYATAARVELLTGLIDEYDRLTGRAQPAPLTPEDVRTLTEATA